MSKQEELKMWVQIGKALKAVPEDCRSINHTAYFLEVKFNIYNLVQGLNLEPIDYVL